MSAADREASHNLPSRLTTFVGREREIAEIGALLGTQRLVTLVGAPGVGKTRLSLQIATARLGSFPGGVWLVELAALADPALVPRAVAGVLGVPEQPGQPLPAALATSLRSRRLLLLLDNCEHLVGAVATLAETLLHACPGLTILATSREPLAIEGEVPRRVPSLSVPPPEALPADGVAQTPPLTASDAVRLFVERARTVAPSFDLTDRNTPSVVRICTQLDGIPLAIELAAARVRALSLEQIAARLDDRFRLLTGGSRTALPRQQAASTDDGPRLGLRLASAIANFWCFRGHHIEGRRWLERTLAASLEDRTSVELSARARALYWAGNLDSLHGDHKKAVPLLERALDLYRQAQDDVGTIRTLGKLGEYLAYLGEYERASPISEESLVLARASGNAGLLAPVLFASAILAWRLGQFEQSAAFGEESVACYRQVGDTHMLPFSLGIASRACRSLGNLTRAAELAEEELHLSRQTQSQAALAIALKDLGAIALDQGDAARALACYAESTIITYQRGDRWNAATSLLGLGRARTIQGDQAFRAARLRPSRSQEGGNGAVDLLLDAAHLLGASEALLTSTGIVLGGDIARARDETRTLLRSRLGDDIAATAFAEGRAMSWERVTAFARAIMVEAAATERHQQATPTPPASRADGAPLTRREQQIASLVSDGLTNRQIADALGLSERTIDAHIRNIMAKLGVGARAQVAAWSVAHHLARPR